MPKGYSVSVPAVNIKVGETVKCVLSVSGPGPITLNKPYKPDDVIHVRFKVNPQVIKVTNVKMLQNFDHVAPLDHTIFGWTWTGQVSEAPPTSTVRTYVAYEWFWEGPGDPNLIEKPFDVQMGPLMEIEVLGVTAGSTRIDIVSAIFGEWDSGTVIADGDVAVS